jgi:molybdopterin synthase sulfur carrier subunit
MQIKVYATLRDVVGGKQVEIDVGAGMTARQLLKAIIARHPQLSEKFFDDQDRLRPSIHVLVNGRDIQHLDGLDTKIGPDAGVSIFPPVGGGSP